MKNSIARYLVCVDDSKPRAAPLTLESQLCFALYSTLHAVGKVYADLLPELGLTYPQYLVMLVLWECDDRGMKELGERLHLDSGTLTPLLKRMEAGGLIRRTRDADDERQVRISLTEKGRDLRRIADCVPARVGASMGLGPERIGALRDDLLGLRASLSSKRARSGAAATQPVAPRQTSPRRARGSRRS